MTRRDGTRPASLCGAFVGGPFLVWLTAYTRRDSCSDGGAHDATVDVP